MRSHRQRAQLKRAGREKQSGEKRISARANVRSEGSRVLTGQAKKLLLICSGEEAPNLHFLDPLEPSTASRKQEDSLKQMLMQGGSGGAGLQCRKLQGGMRGKNQEKLGRADEEGMKQPSCSQRHFPRAQKFGEGMEERGERSWGRHRWQGTDSKRDAWETEKIRQKLWREGGKKGTRPMPGAD